MQLWQVKIVVFMQMLDMWRNASGPLATRPVLVKALKACKFMEAAGKKLTKSNNY